METADDSLSSDMILLPDRIHNHDIGYEQASAVSAYED
jgi:hypothetical protein